MISQSVFHLDEDVIEILIESNKEIDFNKIGALAYYSGNSKIMKTMIPHMNCDEILSKIAWWALEWNAWDMARDSTVKIKRPVDKTNSLIKIAIIKDNTEIIDILFDLCIDQRENIETFIENHDIKTNSAKYYLNICRVIDDKQKLKETIQDNTKDIKSTSNKIKRF